MTVDPNSIPDADELVDSLTEEDGIEEDDPINDAAEWLANLGNDNDEGTEETEIVEDTVDAVETTPPAPVENKIDLETLVAGLRHEWMVITPETAQKILDEMPTNRRTKSKSLKTITRALETDDWHLNGEPIKFDDDGKLVDGQHRLRACIETGRSFATGAIYGVTPEARMTIDQGAPRRLADQIDISDVDITSGEASALADVTSTLYSYLNGSLPEGRAVEPTVGQGFDFFQAHKSDLMVYTAIAVKLQKDPDLKIKRGPIGALMYVFDAADEELSTKFFMSLQSGLGEDGQLLAEDHPVAVLRKRFNKGTHDKAHRVSNKRQILAMVIKTWNAFCQGETMSKIRYSTGEAFPEVYGLDADALPNPDAVTA